MIGVVQLWMRKVLGKSVCLCYVDSYECESQLLSIFSHSFPQFISSLLCLLVKFVWFLSLKKFVKRESSSSKIKMPTSIFFMNFLIFLLLRSNRFWFRAIRLVNNFHFNTQDIYICLTICAAMDTMWYFQGHSITTRHKRNTHPQIQAQIFIPSNSHSGWERFIRIGGKQIQVIFRLSSYDQLI